MQAVSALIFTFERSGENSRMCKEKRRKAKSHRTQLACNQKNRDVKFSPCDFLLRVLFLIIYFFSLALLVK